MATFYGGEQYIDNLSYQQQLTPSNGQTFDIYTVPAGYYAVIRYCWFAENQIGPYSEILVVSNYAGAFVGSFTEGSFSISKSWSESTLDEWNNRNLRIDEGYKVRFSHITNQPTLNTSYFVNIDLYKKP